MWTGISSVLLATFVVSGLSLPRPDDRAYKIPNVGNGQRSQFYVLHSDGTFKYGFDTGDGAFEKVMSKHVGNRGGKFGYVDPDGKSIRLEYEAGKGGFVARGDHLPKPSPELAEALASVVRSNLPFVDPLASSDSDSSYGFEFHSDDHSRNEKSDSDGTVTGSYSYVDENGVKRSFTYKAGKGIGFVIEGDGLTQDVSVPAAPPTFRQSTARKTGQVASTRRAQTPSRHFGAAYRTSTSFGGPDANIAQTRSQTPGDASYSFSFNAGDHSRSESSDSGLNVDGTFSFVADDGNKRTLNYVAGSGTGFKAEGAHLPKAPEVDASRGTHASFGQRKTTSSVAHRGQVKSSFKSTPLRIGATRGVVTQNQAQGQTHLLSSAARLRGSQQTSSSAIHRGHVRGPVKSTPVATPGHLPVQTTRASSGTIFRGSQRTSFVSPTRSFEEANIRSSSSPAGPYSFSYETGSHSRSESGDANNKVVGEFDFVAEDDGKRREINYEAGSSTGFVAEGAHIPRGPEVPGAPSGQPTGRLVRQRTQPFVDPLADSDTDASYKFEFDSDTYSRSESADEDGNISGTYTVVEEDGTRITYRFRAGKGIGFETEEVSRSKGPKPARPTPYSGPLAGTLSHTSTKHSHGFGSSTRIGSTASTRSSHGSFKTSAGVKSVGTGVSRSSQIKTPSRSSFASPKPRTSFKKTSSHASSFLPSAILKSSQGLSRSQAFVDPLADSDTDASYKFEFDSDTYSRSESADKDGNISGTYTVVEEDGTRITYRFRAGKGIGFETEEVSRSKGPKPSRPTPYSGPLAGTLSHTSTKHSHGFGSSTRIGSTASTRSSHGSFKTSAGVKSVSTGVSRSSQIKTPSISPFTSQKARTSFKKTSSHASSFTPSAVLKSSQGISHSQQVLPGSTLNSYPLTPTSSKFGYVLKFDNK